MSNQVRTAAHRVARCAGVALAAILAAGGSAEAGVFSPGNLVVLQDGSGSAALSSAGTAIYLDQFTTAGALVNSTAIPSSGATALVDSGTATSEGSITLSPNGQYLVVAGYNTNAGVASVASSPALAVPRGLATVDFMGNYNLAATTTTAFSANNIRSGTTDGKGNFWAVGANSGVDYLGTGPTSPITGTILNNRVIQDIGGNLYYASGSGSRGVYEIIGTPASGSTITNTVIPTGTQFGTISSPYDFVFNPGMTIAYVADFNEYTNSSTLGGIEKWTSAGGTWTYAYTLSYGTNGAFGLAVDFSGANPLIYATTASGTTLYEITDTGTGGTNGATLLATAAANEAFRGLAFAPTNVVAPPVLTSITPASIVTNAGATAAFTVSATGGGTLGYYWYFETATGTNLIAGATGPSLTLPNLLSQNSGNYQVVVSNASFQTVTSSVVSLAVGGLVVLRDGNGSAALSSAATPIYLDQYTTTGIFVSSNAIPTNGVSALVNSGTATSEGALSLSTNGQYVVVEGYNTNVGVTSVASTTATAVPRALATVDDNGNYTLAVKTTTGFSGNNIRSGTTDGNGNFWAVGANGGLNYLGTGTPAAIGGTVLNSRVVQEIGGNLYYGTGSGAHGIYEVAGAPVSGPVTTNILINLTNNFPGESSPYGFAFNPALTVAYVADSDMYTNSSTVGGVQKWTLVGSAWTYAYTLSYGTNGATGIAVDFSQANPLIYATTASGNYLYEIPDTGVGGTNGATLLATAAANEAFRGLVFAPTNNVVPAAPTITGITPSALATNVGSAVAFTLTANLGNPAATASWYKISGTTTGLVAGVTGTTLSFPSVSLTNTGRYFAVLANNSGSATSSIASLTVTASPTIGSITPLSVTTNAGQSVTFTLSATLGTPAGGVYWYQTGSPATLIAGATNTTLTLSDVLGGNSGGYFAVVSNSYGSVTSSVATLTVTGDPAITAQPASAEGLLGGTVQFTVGVAATAPGFQWYQYDGASVYTPVVNGPQPSGSVVSGANTATLTFTGVQPADATNFVVVVTDSFGSVTSSVASLFSVNLTGSLLAFWDFDGTNFLDTAVNPNSINDPVPFIGLGTASPVGSTFDPGTSPFSGAVDPDDGAGTSIDGIPSPTPNYSWGTDNYPASGGNKQNGVQFNVSTVGAKNITVSYESRVSATASDYERLQYTTDGVTWIDYPSSSTFGGVGTTYLPFSYNLTGFPGVDNNPNFGVRVVTEFESTATYGIGTTDGYVGTANSYGTGGTVTYDIVAFRGDAITNNTTPPVITSTFTNVISPDYAPVTLDFTVSDATFTGDQLTYSAVSLDPATVSGNFAFGGSGANRTLTITPNETPDQVDAAPILVTVTDPNGDSTVAWFDLTLTSINLAPTNSLTLLATTNTLANATLTIPFTVADDRTPASGLTYSVLSGNNTVVPATNIVIINAGSANPSVVITPATNQVGLAKVSVITYDNDPVEPRSTTANIEVMVRPNTNVVLVDYFNYDNSGSLDTISSGFWNHLSGNFGQLQAGSGSAVVDTLDNTENLQAHLLGSPYLTNSGAILYASFTVDMDPNKLPVGNGTYFALFNNGAGVTGPYEGRVLAATNGAAPGYYRIGICNFGSTATNGVMFPLDLAPGTNYVVVESLALTNGFSTVWVSPSSQSSYSVTDTTPAPTPTNLYNIADFELRESGGAGGSISVGSLKVGTTFDSVFPSLYIQSFGTNVVLTWSDPTLGVQAATDLTAGFVDLPGITSPYTNNISTNDVLFFRFGQ